MSSLSAEDIAQICHEANRAYQLILNSPFNAVSPSWLECSEEMRESIIKGVYKAQLGVGPAELHEAWCDYKFTQGWRYGPVKNESEKTHPCLVDYSLLPPEEVRKDVLFYAIVYTFS